MGGAGSAATLRILSSGSSGSIVDVASDILALGWRGCLLRFGGVEFALRRLVFSGGTVDAALPFSSFASMRVRQSIEATVPESGHFQSR